MLAEMKLPSETSKGTYAGDEIHQPNESRFFQWRILALTGGGWLHGVHPNDINDTDSLTVLREGDASTSLDRLNHFTGVYRWIKEVVVQQRKRAGYPQEFIVTSANH